PDRQQVIGEYQEALVARAKYLRPAFQSAQVFPCRPALPYPPLPIDWPCRETPAFHIHQQAGSRFPINDKIEALDPEVAEHGPARFIHRHITEPMPLQVGLERGFVVVAAVHDSRPFEYSTDGTRDLGGGNGDFLAPGEVLDFPRALRKFVRAGDQG